MGKSSDKVWLHWYSQGNFAMCNYCKSQQRRHATRCRKHTSNCPHAPTSVRKEFQQSMISRASFALERLQTATIVIKPTENESSVGVAEQQIDELSVNIKVEEIDQQQSPTVPEVVPVSESRSNRNDAVFSSGPHLAASSSYRQKILDGHVNRLSAPHLKELQKLFTKAMISGNVSFNWLNDIHLKTFFTKLGSGFTLPSRWEASHSILDKLEYESLEQINGKLRTEWFFSLIPDGWTNVKGLSVVNVLLANSFSCVFYKSFETGDCVQTGDYLRGQFSNIISEIEEKYGEGKIVAIVSDRGSNYLNARNQISAHQPSIISISCAAHAINLLTGDISKLPSVQTHLNASKTIIKEIKNSKTKLGEYYAEFDRYIEEEKLEQRIHQKVSLSLPAVTRWFGVRDMLHKLRLSKNVLLRLAIKENCLLSASARRTILNPNFWYKMDRLYSLYSVLINGIATVEASDCCLSDVVEEFEKLKQLFHQTGGSHSILVDGLTAIELRKAMQFFENRSSEEILTWYHYLSNLLDPRYTGQCFMNDQTKMIHVLNKLESYAEHVNVAVQEEQRRELGRQLTSFRMKTGYFSSNMLYHPKPLLFWSNFLQFSETSLIASVAIRLFSIPASSADVERSFSMQAYVHSKSRNRLTETNVDKIMRVKWHLIQEEKQRKEEVRMQKQFSNLKMDSQTEYEVDESDIDDVIFFDEPFSEAELLTD